VKKPLKHLLDFHVDKLTNSIENIITKDSFKTDILPLSPKDLKNITKKMGGVLIGQTNLKPLTEQHINL
jgi:hypothetical protein